ncbi:MAG: glycosyltransferase family 9 protein [Flavobacteriales bacterium]|nr:MAG: glycosyltransferase family 9 protein [Flavobacteriales bacterium]
MKVLIIRFSSIGDIVLTSPVVRCLKLQRPDAEIHFLTKRVFADLVQHSPHIAKVHLLDDGLGSILPVLKNERFDAVVDLHNNLRTWRVKRALGLPSHSFPKLNWEKWLMVNLKADRLPKEHIVDRYLRTVNGLGVKNDGMGLDFFVPANSEVPLTAFPEPHRNGYTALCIGGGHATKRLPPHKLLALAREVQGPIVIIGGNEDSATAQRISTEIGPRVFDATGQFDLLGSASLIRQARSVVAHDSGAMHVAAAFNKPLVSVWGNTVPHFGMGPYMPQHKERAHVVEVMGLGCRPCSKLGYDKCPKGHFHCMEKQDIGRIAQLVNQ